MIAQANLWIIRMSLVMIVSINERGIPNADIQNMKEKFLYNHIDFAADE